MSAFKAWFHFRCGFLYLGRQQVRLMAGWLPPMGENWKEFLGLGFIPSIWREKMLDDIFLCAFLKKVYFY